MPATHTNIILFGFLVFALVLSDGAIKAQLIKPKAKLVPVVGQQAIQPGRTVSLELRVEFREGIHVQSDKPRDPLLIPTVLTFTLPEGGTVEEIIYPPATDFVLVGQKEPLAVFEHEFTIEGQIAVGADVSPGELVVPGVFRYQACDDTQCFPPATAAVEWHVHVEPAGQG